MHVISRKPFNEAMLMYPNHELALTELLNVLEKKTFTQPEGDEAVYSFTG
ncbi:cytoplasmic protein [Salmonella enterica subsp. enterica]|uniref:Cytoplasmic protein n=1 Tax=Salmonella enterica I TaxID=59201 RepID=A0A379X554_SALET|nr:cytoplasmic protein [Salmonella enterica subsp. enterica]